MPGRLGGPVQSDPMPRRLLVFLAAFGAAVAVAAQPWVPDPLEPVSSGGLAAVDRALARLSVHARLLVIGAHPDDEDNALMTWVARGVGGEAAYLSLSRGEGGQNLIGPELGIELGAIRTGELLAARRLEGSRQYFTRAYDFGYTRSLDETFVRWPREVLQEDTIRVVRRFKPQVIVAVFPADERAGHGQHQASAMVAADAFRMAEDEGVFPGLPDGPWTPAAFYRRAWIRFGEEPTHDYSLAALDPISGRSLGQLAAASRSYHRSQDMGREQLAGPARGGLVWIAGGAGGAGEGPFAGVDTRLAAIVDTIPAGPGRDEVAGILTRVEQIARQARRELAPAAVEAAVPALSEILGLLRQAERRLEAGGPEAMAARALVTEKASVASYGLAAAAGVVVEATADRATVAGGGSLEIEALVWPAGDTDVVVSEVKVLVPGGWRVEALDTGAMGKAVHRRRFRVEAFGVAFASTPLYYLRKELRHEAYLKDLSEPLEPVGRLGAPAHHDLRWFLRGDLYDPTSELPPELLGEPLGPPLVRLRFGLEISGRPVVLEREAVHRFADQAFGERRLPLRLVAPLEVSLEPQVALVPSLTAPAELTVTVRSNLDGPIEGTFGLGGNDPKTVFTLAGEGDSETARLPFDPLPGERRRTAIAEARTEGFWTTGGQRLLSYPHIRPVTVPVMAASLVSRFALALPQLDRVGYVRGASDRLPEVLAAVGVPIELLDADVLDTGNLSGYDAIVIGSRAYETDGALRRANGRLLEYARGGGLLVVQYQQYQFVRGGFAPFPLEILRPHGRVTDEAAEVEALAPDHPVFHRPNEIGAADWQGWVQERGLYFAGTWDERYEPLLSLADPGRESERGALLVASVGEGTYVYTGLSFFRQLPAGVAGAVRLFVNLLALGER